MPRLSVWLVRTACLNLVLGFTVGGLLLFHKGVPLHPLVWYLLPVHIEAVLIGWTLQMALGVAFWSLPRFKLGPPRGDERIVWLAYVLINFGVLAVMASSFFSSTAGLLLFGRCAEALAVVAFAVHTWPRIKHWGQ